MSQRFNTIVNAANSILDAVEAVRTELDTARSDLAAERNLRLAAEAEVERLKALLDTDPEPAPAEPQVSYDRVPVPVGTPVFSTMPEIKRALEANRIDQRPIVITGEHTERIRLEKGNRNVWFIGGKSTGIKGGNWWEAAISYGNGVENVYIYDWTFTDCHIGIYVYDFHESHIDGCTFIGGSQAIHVIWNNVGRPATGVRIVNNKFRNLTGHVVELQTSASGPHFSNPVITVRGAKFNYNSATGSPVLPTQRMVFSIATEHAKDCEAIGNRTEGGHWAWEVMCGFHFHANDAKNCDIMFAVNNRSTRGQENYPGATEFPPPSTFGANSFDPSSVRVFKQGY